MTDDVPPAEKRNSARTRTTGLVIAGVIVVMAATACIFVIYSRDARITLVTFQRITIGMARADLHEMLGRPGYGQVVTGIVNSPNLFTSNFSDDKQPLYEMGYDDFILETWYSPDVTINAVVDANDKVVCRYTTGGQQQTFLGRIWPRERVTLADRKPNQTP